MKIKALKPFSNGKISMEQYEVKDVEDTLGAQLVAAGVAVEIGGGSGGVLVVTETNDTLDKTWQEIHDAFVAGSVRIQNGTGTIMNVKIVGYSSREGTYSVVCDNYQTDETYTTDSASGYPTQD